MKQTKTAMALLLSLLLMGCSEEFQIYNTPTFGLVETLLPTSTEMQITPTDMPPKGIVRLTKLVTQGKYRGATQRQDVYYSSVENHDDYISLSGLIRCDTEESFPPSSRAELIADGSLLESIGQTPGEHFKHWNFCLDPL